MEQVKGCEVVVGVKRPTSDCSSEGEGTKKLKISLNISETWDWINNIELAGMVDESMAVSTADDGDSREETEYEDNSQAGSEQSIGLSGAEEDAVLIAEGIVDTDEDYSILSDQESIPPLASPEPKSSDWKPYMNTSNDDSDSGVAEGVTGNFTNLCMNRRSHRVLEGVITETGPFIPVSLEFNQNMGPDNEWEEVLDNEGQLTGFE